MTPTIKQRLLRRIDEYVTRTDFNKVLEKERFSCFEKVLLFTKLMSGTLKNVSYNADNYFFEAGLGTIILMDIDGIQVSAVKRNIVYKGYSIGVDTETQHDAIVFRGWPAKQIFERGQSALQR